MESDFISSRHILTSDGAPRFAVFVAGGQEILVAGAQLRRFRFSDGALLATEQLPAVPTAFALPDGQTHLALVCGTTLELRDAHTLQPLARTSLPDGGMAICFSPDGSQLVVRSAASLSVYRTDSLEQDAEWPVADQFQEYDVLWLPDGRIATTSDTGVDLFDSATHRGLQSLRFNDPDLLPPRKLLLRDGQLGVLSTFHYFEADSATGELVDRYRCDWSEQARHVPARGWLLIGDISGWVGILDQSTGTLIRRLRGHTHLVSSLDTDSSGRWLLSVCKHDVRIWDVDRLESDPAAYRCTGDECASLDDLAAAGIAFARNGQELLTAQRGAVQRWSIPDFQLIEKLPIDRGQGAVQFLSDVEAFAGLWMEDEPTSFRAWLFDMATHRSQQLFIFPCAYPEFARVNRAKTIIAAFACDALHLLDFVTGTTRHSLVTHAGPIEDSRFCGLEFSPDDGVLYTAGRDGTLNEWNPATGELLRTYSAPEGNIESFALSPDGTLLAISEKQRIVIFDPRAWLPLRAFELGSRVHWSSLAITSDLSRLAFATTHKNEIQILSLETGEVMRTLRGHTSGVRMVRWSPGGEYLASASDDDTLKLWRFS